MSNVLTKKDLREVGHRWIATSISTYSYELQLAPSVVYSVSKALRKIYPNDDDYREALDNRFKYYNCMPWLSKLLIGASLAIEDTRGLEGKDAVSDLMIGLMGPLSGIGDTIGWVMLPTIFGSIAAYMAQQGSVVGLMIWLAINAVFWVIRLKLVDIGYHQGIKIITQFGKELNVFTEAASVLGITVVGCLIATAVNLQCGLKFTSGDVVLKVQEQIDGVMPAMLPVIAVAIMYWLLKHKKVNMTWIIVGTLVISMIGAAFGIFAV